MIALDFGEGLVGGGGGCTRLRRHRARTAAGRRFRLRTAGSSGTDAPKLPQAHLNPDYAQFPTYVTHFFVPKFNSGTSNDVN